MHKLLPTTEFLTFNSYTGNSRSIEVSIQYICVYMSAYIVIVYVNTHGIFLCKYT